MYIINENLQVIDMNIFYIRMLIRRVRVSQYPYS